jgi:hypothetical protein
MNNNQHLIVKDSKTGGKGVFTTIQLPAKKPIIEWVGKFYTQDTLPNPKDPNVMQVGPNTYLGPSGGLDDYINHSCNPNCSVQVVGGRAILYAMYVIPMGNELTFDYSANSTDTLDTWQMKCKCGSYNCRQLISGFETLSPALQEEYKKKGMVALYITNQIIQKQ